MKERVDCGRSLARELILMTDALYLFGHGGSNSSKRATSIPNVRDNSTVALEVNLISLPSVFPVICVQSHIPSITWSFLGTTGKPHKTNGLVGPVSI